MKKQKTVKWAEIARSLRLLGLMPDDTKAEALRWAIMLKNRVSTGDVEKLGRGRYRLVRREQ